MVAAEMGLTRLSAVDDDEPPSCYWGPRQPCSFVGTSAISREQGRIAHCFHDIEDDGIGICVLIVGEHDHGKTTIENHGSLRSEPANLAVMPDDRSVVKSRQGKPEPVGAATRNRKAVGGGHGMERRG